MKITTLIENRRSKSDSKLAAEWGLSLHIDFNGHRILFDSGFSGSFVKNAEYLAVDLASVDVAVLSHHHFDHGNGFRRFFEINQTAKVHLGEAPLGECFGGRGPLLKKYVGLDKRLLTDFPDRFVTINEPTEILPDVFVFPHISGPYPMPKGNRHLFVRKNGQRIPDHFNHEIVMAIKESNQLFIFSGCSHNGVLNMVDTAAKAFDGLPVIAVIGGFHLVSSPLFKIMEDNRREVEELARKVLDYPIGQVYTGHCTSTKALVILKDIMGERLSELTTGSIIEV